MEKASDRGRKNIHFRQTPKEFRSANQAQTFGHIKRNLPYRIYTFTKSKMISAFTIVKGGFARIRMGLPKDARRIK